MLPRTLKKIVPLFLTRVSSNWELLTISRTQMQTNQAEVSDTSALRIYTLLIYSMLGVLRVVTVNRAALWDVTPCSLVEGSKGFRGVQSFHYHARRESLAGTE